MTTREQAIQWWNGFEASTRESLCSDYYKNRQFDTLTGSEIESMCKAEFPKKETKIENIYLNRLKEQYKESLGGSLDDRHYRRNRYNAVRVFCLDTQLISFNDIELMEFEVNSVF